MLGASRERALALRGRLGDSLFPDAGPAVLPSLGRGEAAVLALSLIALAVILQLIRPGLSTSLNSLWAEDGQVFLQGALTHGIDQIGAEYSGYIVLFPRLVGEAATVLPLHDAAAVTSILAAIAVGCAGLAVWHGSAGHISNPYLRGTLAVLTVLAPTGGLETIDSSSYASWYMLFGVFWLLLWRPRTNLGALLGAIFIVLAGLSNPGIWFFLPLAFLRLLALRDRRDAIVLGAFFGSAFVQAIALAVTDYEAVEPVWTSDIWTVLLQRVLDGAAFGLRLGGIAWAHFGWTLLIVLLVLGLLAVAVGLRRAGWGARAIAAVAVPTAVGMFVLSVYQRAVGEPMLWPAHVWFGDAGRYSIVPSLLLVSVAFVLLDEYESRRGRRRFASPTSLAAIALVLLSVGVSFWVKDVAARGEPGWDAAVDQASKECAARPDAVVFLPTAPPGFGLNLPCSAVPSASGDQAQR